MRLFPGGNRRFSDFVILQSLCKLQQNGRIGKTLAKPLFWNVAALEDLPSDKCAAALPFTFPMLAAAAIPNNRHRKCIIYQNVVHN